MSLIADWFLLPATITVCHPVMAIFPARETLLKFPIPIPNCIIKGNVLTRNHQMCCLVQLSEFVNIFSAVLLYRHRKYTANILISAQDVYHHDQFCYHYQFDHIEHILCNILMIWFHFPAHAGKVMSYLWIYYWYISLTKMFHFYICIR